LLRQSVYSRLAGYEDLNDPEWHLPRPTKAPCTANPTQSCIRRRSGVCYRAGHTR
jgi:hypothetical protein